MDVFVGALEKRMTPQDLKALRVLIVEDEPDMRAILFADLAELGVGHIFLADKAATALDFIGDSAAHFDIILCDWNMPSLSGLDLIRAMHGRNIYIPVIMVTGRADQASVIEATAHGISGYLCKPFTPEQMQARLQSVLRRRKTIESCH